MPDFQDFPPGSFAVEPRDFRQDRVAHSFEGLCDKRRADDARGMTGAERDHAAAPTLRQRHREKIAHEIDDVLEVVVEANSLGCVGADACTIFIIELGRAANAGVETGIFRQRRGDDALSDIGFYQDQRFAVRSGAVPDRTDI